MRTRMSKGAIGARRALRPQPDSLGSPQDSCHNPDVESRWPPFSTMMLRSKHASIAPSIEPGAARVELRETDERAVIA